MSPPRASPRIRAPAGDGWGVLVLTQVNSMSTASPTPPERARKAEQRVLQVLQERERAVSLATAMGTSESTISRIKNERLAEVLLFLARLGFKVVPADHKCVDPEAHAFLTRTHERVLAKAPNLIWGEDE